jgi:hypothetical protein
MRRAPYVKSIAAPEPARLLKAVTLNEIERIFAVTDALGISREALVIPLRTEHPGRVSTMKDGKLEIVVERDGGFDEFIAALPERIRALTDSEAG